MIDIFGFVAFNGNCTAAIRASTMKPFCVNNLLQSLISGTFFGIYCYGRRGTDYRHRFFENREYLIIVLGKPLVRENFRTIVNVDCKNLASDISNLYFDYGIEVVKLLKGSFNIIVLNKKRKSVKILSDCMNLFPIFYYYDNTKFIFSTVLKLVAVYSNKDKSIYDRAVVEAVLFNYTIGNKTYYENVFMQRSASILEVDQRKLNENKYWELLNEITQRKYIHEYALEHGCNILHNNIKQLTEVTSRIACTLTGGYDSRAILSILLNHGMNPVCFSYGPRESADIRVPLKIMEKIAINYSPLYLDSEDFLKNVSEYTMKAIFQSNGFATCLNANSLYGYMTYSRYANSVVMGIYGSEILKPMTSISAIHTKYLTKLFITNDFNESYFINTTAKIVEWLNFGNIRNVIEDIYSEIKSDYISSYEKECTSRLLLYNFIFSESLRKYYMKELHLSKYYVDVVLPFLDADFIHLIFGSGLAGIHNGAFRNVFRRRWANRFYNYCINKFYPELSEIEMDNGIKPKYESRIITLPIVIAQFLRGKCTRRLLGRIEDCNFESLCSFFIDENQRYLEHAIKEESMHNTDMKRLCRLLSINVYLGK